MINSTYKSNDDVYSRVDTLKSDSNLNYNSFLLFFLLYFVAGSVVVVVVLATVPFLA